jgi:hypothetical protein
VPLLPPALDDRSYSDLVQDMLASIPAHTPEWTIQQEGDPGRTLIELFAWLADSILYRANLIPERQRLAFLKLLGMPLKPAAAATTIISIAPNASAAAAVTLASGATISGPPNFETITELDVLPVTGQMYIKAPLSQAQQTSSMSLLTGLQSLYKLPNVPSGYTTTPVFINNAVDSNGVDVFGGTIDQCLWVALIAPKPANRAAIRANLGGSNGQRILSLGFLPALSNADPFSDIPTQAAVPVTWQISGNTAPGQQALYYPLGIGADSTKGLTTAGVVQLLLPQGADIGAPANDVRSDAMAGVGPKPPRVDDPNFDSVLVTWIRVNVQSALTLGWAGINAVKIDQRTTYQNVIAGVSDGTPNQQFSLAQTQIDPTTFQLDVDMGPGLGFQLWTPVDDVAVLQGPVAAYVLDPEAGTVTFGNQMQGLIPSVGRRVRARLMRAGGGSAGNLPAGSLASISALDVNGNPASQLTVQQPIPTAGGADSETLDQAEQRIPSTLRHQSRAVTAQDYKDLVQQMPGSGVARVEVLPLFKPQTREFNTPGVVSVMAIPPKGTYQPPCPQADRTLLDSVYAYLSPMCPVAAELYTIGTEYVDFGLSVAVEVTNGYNLLQVSQQVEQTLRTYMWPTAPGGQNQQGWALGRTVRSLELLVVAGTVPGVSDVNGLFLFLPQSNGGYQQIPPNSDGNAELTLQAWQLPELLQVLVTPGAEGSNVQPGNLNPVVQTDNNVAVPVVPALC